MEDNDQIDHDLSKNIDVVNYIMLHRIYDVLTIMADLFAKTDEDRQKVSKMIKYHEEGFLLGPSPALRSEENNE